MQLQGNHVLIGIVSSSSHHPSTLILTLTIAGTFMYGLSGGLAGARNGLDLLGVAVLAVVGSMAGGIIRDVLIGVPPQGFRDWRYIAAAGAAGLICFALNNYFGRLERPIQLFNALGLSLFCVTGTSVALADGVAPFQAAILGAITGIGGGVARDVLLGETPVVLRRGLNAVPALLGGAVVAVAHAAGSDRGIFAVLGGAVCFCLWAVGSRFGLELPTVPHRSSQKGSLSQEQPRQRQPGREPSGGPARVKLNDQRDHRSDHHG